MGINHAESTNSYKVHSLMCLELKKSVDRISDIYSDIDSSRPRCTSGLKVLCQLHVTVEKAKLLIQHCSESSKLYLAITGDRLLLRCKNIQKDLVLCLGQIQNMVPTLLAAKISGIIDHFKGVEFRLESTEDEAGKVILALMRRDIPGSQAANNSELEALKVAAARLKIVSYVDVVLEKRSIKRVLDRVCDSNPSKKKILKYLWYLIKKYGDVILRYRNEDNLAPNEQHVHSVRDETQADNSDPAEPPDEFKCPMSMILMYDPVIIASGKTYERVWIEKWFNEGHETCPMTCMRLDNLSLTPNVVMKSLISKWCSEHGITVSDPCAQSMSAPISTEKLLSTKSIASIASSIDNLCLKVSGVSIQSLDINYGPDFVDKQNSVCYVGIASLSQLATLPWVSQCKVVQDVKEQLKKTEKACDWMFPSSHLKQLVKFLTNAHNLCDLQAQKDSAEVLLEILSKSRTETSSIDEEAIYLFASFLDSEITGEALAILEVFSCQKFYQSGIVASGILPSILKVLDTQIEEFRGVAMKILSNLSCNIDIAYHIHYLDCIPKLVPFLGDCNLAGYSLNVISNLCNIEEGRKSVAENHGIIISIAKLLQTGTKQEQETGLEVLLALCSEHAECHKLLMQETIFQTLFTISANGNSRTKVISTELFQLLGQLLDSNGNSNPNSGFSLDISSSSNSSKHSKGKKSSSKAFGYVRRKISRLFNHSH